MEKHSEVVDCLLTSITLYYDILEDRQWILAQLLKTFVNYSLHLPLITGRLKWGFLSEIH
jgi:hypothetical protein